METSTKDPNLDLGSIVAGLTAELVFVLLPVVLVALFLLINAQASHIWSKPEWAFGACVLFGQAIMRLMIGFAKRAGAAAGKIALTAAGLIVLGLLPSAVFLIAILSKNHQGEIVPGWMSGLQVFWFVAGSVCYVVFGTVAEVWGLRDHSRTFRSKGF